MEKLLKLIKLLPEPKRSFYLHRVKELITRKQAKGLASVFDTLATTRAVEGDTVLQEEISTVQDGLSTEQQRLAKLQQEVDQSLLKIESTTGETQTALKKSLKVAREKLTKKVDRAAAINQKSVEDANKLTKATANRVDQALATMFLKAEDISNKTDGYITKKDLPKKVEVIGGTNITVVMEVSDKKIAYTVNADQLRQELIGIAGTGLSRTAADLSYLKLDASNGPITGNLTINADLGAKTLTGANLISTVATGTSPYACTSVTLNTNLNADLLDGQHGAYYLDSANFTGTNWTDLTDGGNTTLHIHDIYLLADGTRALAGAWDMGDQALTNVNIDSGNIHNDVTHTQWDTAYTHSQDTSQAHPDYLVNTGDDATVGSLTAQNYYLWNGNFVGESGGLVGWTFDSTNDDITTMVKVGIGTAAPAFKLDVYCDTADATNIARII